MNNEEHKALVRRALGVNAPRFAPSRTQLALDLYWDTAYLDEASSRIARQAAKAHAERFKGIGDFVCRARESQGLLI